MVSIEGVFGERIGSVIRGWTATINGINRKYAVPRIQMSPAVKIALMFLRIYLILLVVLLGYKFWTLLQ